MRAPSLTAAGDVTEPRPPTPIAPAQTSAPLRAPGGNRAEGGARPGGGTRLEGTLPEHLDRLGPLAALLRDPEVTDILVNGPDRVWVERSGRLALTGVRFADDGAVRSLAVRLVASGGRRLDTAMPFADVRLPGGIRLHAMLSPPALDGTCLSLRRPRPRPFTLTDLQVAGTLELGTATMLRAVLDARLTALISGGTGTGKSTLLAALLDAAPAAERVVLVEDTAELVLSRINVVRTEARPANIEGAGEITQRDLVRQALRMRPDRLVVGEVRGPEVLDLLMAMNTGHEGGLGTVHANAAETLPARLEALGTLAGLQRAALHSHLAAAVQVAVHLERDGTGTRRVTNIGVLSREADGLVRVIPALVTAGRRSPPRGSRDGGGATGRDSRRDGGRGNGRGAGRPAAGEGLPLLLRLLSDRGVSLTPGSLTAPAVPAVPAAESPRDPR